MKSLAFFKHAFISGSIFALLVSVAFGQDADLKNRFESEYRAWKTTIEENKFHSMAHYNPHIYEIAKMGVPVLSLIIEKMENKEYAVDFLLVQAVSLITKKRFPREDWPEGKLADAHSKAAMYVDWWHNGIKNTSNAFNQYYQEWKRYVDEENEEIAEEKLKYCTILGIAAIPFMIEKIEEGDLEFIKLISDLTNGSLSENASKEECIQWWNNSKEKWTIKFDDSEPKDDKE